MFIVLQGAITPRWSEVPMLIGINGQQVLEAALSAPGRERGQCDIASLAEYLDGRFYPGILQALSRLYLDTVRPYLEEAMDIDSEVERVFDNPIAFFECADEDEARMYLSSYFWDAVNDQSPQHVVRAFIAFNEYGLGDWANALVQAGFAHNEHQVPNFGEMLFDPSSIRSEIVMISERQMADLLAELIVDFRIHA